MRPSTAKSLLRAFTLDHPELDDRGCLCDPARLDQTATVARPIVKGHKIGLTSKAMQNAVGISEPDYGVLFADMFYPDATAIPFERFSAPAHRGGTGIRAEDAVDRARIALLFDVLNATDYVTPALEILETRMHRFDPETKAARKVMDTIADNAANAALVVGGRPIRPLDADLRWIGALLFRNGQIEETGIAAGVLNHPANGVAWLANRLAAPWRAPRGR